MALGIGALGLAGITLALTIPAGAASTTAASGSSSTAAPTALPPQTPDAAGTVWLCKPGETNDPCAGDLSITPLTRSGPGKPVTVQPAANPPADCFYVYPTASLEKTPNSDLTISTDETLVARSQTSQFSQDCRVFAPMYHQVTLSAIFSIFSGKKPNLTEGLTDVENAWKDYLANYNDGRPVVLIGHSQGSAVLEAMIAQQIDGKPIQNQIVSALLVGGDVLVPQGKTVGGMFQHVPVCTSPTETQCVISYSTFDTPPGKISLFGRSLIKGDEVVCVNPGQIGAPVGTAVPITPEEPDNVGGFFAMDSPKPVPGVTTPWWSEPGLYTAACESQGGANWLNVSAPPWSFFDTRPRFAQSLGTFGGMHIVDYNIAMANLVQDVATETAAWEANAGH